MTRSPRFGPADGLYCELSVRYQSAPDPVSAPDQAGREGKREMSAPRPYETDPFHPHSSLHTQYEKQFLCICKGIPVVCPMWYSHCVFVRCTFSFAHALFYKLLLKGPEPF